MGHNVSGIRERRDLGQFIYGIILANLGKGWARKLSHYVWCLDFTEKHWGKYLSGAGSGLIINFLLKPKVVKFGKIAINDFYPNG